MRSPMRRAMRSAPSNSARAALPYRYARSRWPRLGRGPRATGRSTTIASRARRRRRAIAPRGTARPERGRLPLAPSWRSIPRRSAMSRHAESRHARRAVKARRRRRRRCAYSLVELPPLAPSACRSRASWPRFGPSRWPRVRCRCGARTRRYPTRQRADVHPTRAARPRLEWPSRRFRRRRTSPPDRPRAPGQTRLRPRRSW